MNAGIRGPHFFLSPGEDLYPSDAVDPLVSLSQAQLDDSGSLFWPSQGNQIGSSPDEATVDFLEAILLLNYDDFQVVYGPFSYDRVASKG